MIDKLPTADGGEIERVPLAGAVDPDRRRAAYEQCVAGCITAYSNADDGDQR